MGLVCIPGKLDECGKSWTAIETGDFLTYFTDRTEESRKAEFKRRLESYGKFRLRSNPQRDASSLKVVTSVENKSHPISSGDTFVAWGPDTYRYWNDGTG